MSKTIPYPIVAVGILVAVSVTATHAAQELPLAIGTKLQLFVDDALIEDMSGVDLLLHRPVPAEVAFPFNQPWEGNISSFATVMKDGDIYRMYYRGYTDVSNSKSVIAYAESRDGIHWVKPELGLFNYKGSARNNIIWMANDQTLGTKRYLRYPKPKFSRPVIREYLVREEPVKESVGVVFAPFRDDNPAADNDERYKAIAGFPPMVLGSPDGIRWHFLQDKPVMTGEHYDSLNTALWDPRIGQYVAYVRLVTYPGRHIIRSIVRRASSDFLHWGSGMLIDVGEAPLEQLYTNAITPYFRAPDIFIGLPMRIDDERKVVAEHPYPGVSDAVFMSSRDGIVFDRRFLEAFIRPGMDRENWTERSIIPAKGIVPTGTGEMSVYYTEHYRHPTNRLRRGTLRTDGFVSVHATYPGGTVVTKPLVCSGRSLEMNAATSAVGIIRVEILDQSGRQMKGFTRIQNVPFYGDTINHTVTWNGSGANLASIAGRTIRLKFYLRDADLYSFRFE